MSNDSQPKEISDPKLAVERSKAWVIPEPVGLLREASKGFSSNSPLQIKAFN